MGDREVLSIHIGQAGVQISHALWELFCAEHGVNCDGNIKESSNNASDGSEESMNGESIGSLFYQLNNSKAVPRAILFDLEPIVIDEVRTGSYRDLWNPRFLISGREDASNNFARGYISIGKDFVDTVMAAVHKLVDTCDNMSAVQIFNSFAGGTGSGFTSLLSEHLSNEYPKTPKFCVSVFPSSCLSNSIVEPYNSLLYNSATVEHMDCVCLMDNETLYQLSVRNLKVDNPTFTLLNRMTSQMAGGLILSHHYQQKGCHGPDYGQLLTNLVPYPRIHYPVLAYSPFTCPESLLYSSHLVSSLTINAFDMENQALGIPPGNVNKYMSCCLLYRGSISPREVFDSLAVVKSTRNITFVEWCPTGFKVGINSIPAMQMPGSALAAPKKSVTVLSGNLAIRGCWEQVLHRFHRMFLRRAFVHWFVGEGLEEEQFTTARKDMDSLILDYAEIAGEKLETNEEDQEDAENENAEVENEKNADNPESAGKISGSKKSAVGSPEMQAEKSGSKKSGSDPTGAGSKKSSKIVGALLGSDRGSTNTKNTNKLSVKSNVKVSIARGEPFQESAMLASQFRPKHVEKSSSISKSDPSKTSSFKFAPEAAQSKSQKSNSNDEPKSVTGGATTSSYPLRCSTECPTTMNTSNVSTTSDNEEFLSLLKKLHINLKIEPESISATN